VRVISSSGRRLLCAVALLTAVGPQALAAETASAPIAIAVFDFEFEDFSAAAGVAGDPARDRMYVDRATAKARQLIEDSPRYRLVDVASVAEPAAKERGLRDCGGCEAAIARDLGADQSFVGVVKRISRTEYTVRFVLRDTRTAKLLLVRQAFRMGADYSWNRGAAALVTAGLINSPEQTPTTAAP
jgi:hypothetical protein